MSTQMSTKKTWTPPKLDKKLAEELIEWRGARFIQIMRYDHFHGKPWYKNLIFWLYKMEEDRARESIDPPKAWTAVAVWIEGISLSELVRFRNLVEDVSLERRGDTGQRESPSTWLRPNLVSREDLDLLGELRDQGLEQECADLEAALYPPQVQRPSHI